MYNSGPYAATGTVLALPVTGISTMWFLIAAFAMIAVGLAIARMVPRTEA